MENGILTLIDLRQPVITFLFFFFYQIMTTTNVCCISNEHVRNSSKIISKFLISEIIGFSVIVKSWLLDFIQLVDHICIQRKTLIFCFLYIIGRINFHVKFLF